jgi:hypothetical protein
MGTPFGNRPFLKKRNKKRKDVDDVSPVETGDYRFANRSATRGKTGAGLILNLVENHE